MLGEALTAIEQLGPIAALRGSRWTYASVNAVHIAGFALLFGAIVPLDLRMMGWRRAMPLRTMAAAVLPVAVAGFVIAAAAGLLLFATRAAEYAGKPLFWFKLALIACALTNALLLHRALQWEAQQDATGAAPPARQRFAGTLSLTLWLAVIVSGRMLAFIE